MTPAQRISSHGLRHVEVIDGFSTAVNLPEKVLSCVRMRSLFCTRLLSVCRAASSSDMFVPLGYRQEPNNHLGGLLTVGPHHLAVVFSCRSSVLKADMEGTHSFTICPSGVDVGIVGRRSYLILAAT